jgi:hypothetical protein
MAKTGSSGTVGETLAFAKRWRRRIPDTQPNLPRDRSLARLRGFFRPLLGALDGR